jgi:hypothetical protein
LGSTGDDEAAVDTTVVYVSPEGSDENEGRSPDRPLRSLQLAVERAQPGDTVLVSEGAYSPVVVDKKSDLVVLVAPESIVEIVGDGYERETGVLIRDSEGISISGLSVTSVLRGIRVESSTDVDLEAVRVHDIGQEGIAFTRRSSRLRLRDSIIEMTGRRPGDNGELPYSAFGEGVYLGTGGLLDDGSVDVVTDVLIENNQISQTTAEAIDVKASVEDVVIRWNRIHDLDVDSGGAIAVGRGIREYSADVLIEQNVIWSIGTSGRYSDGNGMLISSTGVIRNNAIFDVEHRGILVDDDLRAAEQGTLVIEENWIASTGLDAIEDRSDGSEVEVALRELPADESEALRLRFTSGGAVDGPELLRWISCESNSTC